MRDITQGIAVTLLLALAITVFAVSTAGADGTTESPTSAEVTVESPANADETTESPEPEAPELSPVWNWFETANYGFMLGVADIELSKPEGFDIAPYFYDNDFADETGHYGIIAYHQSKFHPRLFTRTKLTYTANADYEGLKIDDTSLSHGYQFNTPGSRKVAVGVSASASLGVIRSTSYRDNATHLAAGVEVSVFVRFYKVCIEAAAIAREADSSTLDELSVNPSYRGTIVSIVAGC